LSSGIWTAAAGAAAKSQIIDTVANNLANVDTPGYKKDLPTFKEYLASLERPQDAVLDFRRSRPTSKEYRTIWPT